MVLIKHALQVSRSTVRWFVPGHRIQVALRVMIRCGIWRMVSMPSLVCAIPCLPSILFQIAFFFHYKTVWQRISAEFSKYCCNKSEGIITRTITTLIETTPDEVLFLVIFKIWCTRFKPSFLKGERDSQQLCKTESLKADDCIGCGMQENKTYRVSFVTAKPSTLQNLLFF